MAILAITLGMGGSLETHGSSGEVPSILEYRWHTQLRPTTALAGGATPNATPVLAFVGNQTIVSDSLAADGTTILSTGLLRMANCSTTAIAYPTNVLITSSSALAEQQNAQDVLHQLAGLTTTPDVFAHGCADPVGLQMTTFGDLIGSSGNTYYAAYVTTNNALQVITTNTSANTSSTTTLVSANVTAFYVADVNKDGNNDLAVLMSDPSTQQPCIGIFLGHGDGTFATPVYYDVPGASALTIADLNSDGAPDLVVAAGSSITTLLGDGTGAFAAGATTALPFAGNALIAADFNGDGKPDLFYGNTVLIGSGTGGFSVGSTLPASQLALIGAYPAAVAAGDLNGDGKVDLAFSGDTGVTILLGNGDGTFHTEGQYSSIGPQQIRIADIDGDGNPDVIVGTLGHGLYASGQNMSTPMSQVLMGRGDGSLVGAPVYPAGFSQALNGPQIAVAGFQGAGSSVLTLQYQLINAVTVPVLSLQTTTSNGQLGAATTSPISNSAIGTPMLAAADINHDGKPDAIVAGNALAVLVNQGNGTFAAEQDYALPDPAVSLAVADFNGDGLPDVAVGVAPPNGQSGPSGVYVLYGQANGTLAAPVQVDAATSGFPSSVTPSALAAGDINGDGFADLVVGDQGTIAQRSGSLHVYLGSASGNFTPVQAPTTGATFYTEVALGDFDNDGKLDLIAVGSVGSTIGSLVPTVYTLLGKGNGSFGSPQSMALVGTDGLGSSSITVGDFNHDGNLDLAVGNINDLTEVFLGFGDGTFFHSALAIAEQPSALAAADLSGSGYADLLVGNAGLTVVASSQSWPTLTRPGTSAPGTFTLTESSAAGSVAPGQSAQTTLTLTPSGGFTGTVAFACSGLPTGAACAFSPASVSVNGGATTSILTLSTTAATASNRPATTPEHPRDPFLPSAPTLAGVIAVAMRRPMGGRERRFVRVRGLITGFALLCAFGVVLALPGCGGGGSGAAGASSGGAGGIPAGTYEVTVTATSGSTSQSVTYKLTVT